MKIFISVFTLFLFNLYAKDEIKFGVFAYAGYEQTKQRYEPLIEYLNRNFNKKVILEVLSQKEMNKKIAAKELDIATTNPAHFLVIRQTEKLSGALATLVSTNETAHTNQLGGVIIVREDSSIKTIHQIKKKTIATPSTKHMGGFRAQAYEFYKIGKSLKANSNTILELHSSHEDVVKAIINKKADVGFIRDNILEKMIKNSEIKKESIRVINEQKNSNHPFIVSTSLYPEWPVFALPNADEEDIKNLLALLFSLKPTSEYAKKSNIYGYTLPQDYLEVEELSRDLRLPPFDEIEIKYYDIWSHYRNDILGILFTFIVILFFYLKEQRGKKFIESILFNVGEGIYGVDKNGNCTWINQKALDMLGFSKKEILYKNQHELFHDHKHSGEIYNQDECPIYLTLNDKETREAEDYFIRKDRTLFPVELTVAPKGKDGAIVIFKDITEIKKIRNAIEAERNLFSSGPVVTIEWSPSQNWPIRYISSNSLNILGYTTEEMLDSSFVYADLIHPDDIDEVFKEVTYNMQNCIDIFEQSYRLKLKSGEYKWFYDFTKFVRDEHNNLVSIIGYFFDQSALKEVEKELANEKQRLLYIIEGTNVGTWEWNIQTGQTTFNEKWAQMIGYTLQELEPISIDTWIDFAHPDDLKRSEKLLQKHFNKESDYYECESRIRHKNGSWIWILDRGKVSSWSKNGKPLIMYGTHQDITKIKEQQKELMEVTKKANTANRVKSEFLANMSHEIRTPMNAIIGLSELIFDTKLDSEQKEIVSKINGSSKMLLGIINDILDYSKIEAKKLELEYKNFNLINIILQLDAIFKQDADKKNIGLHFNINKNTPSSIKGDELRLNQVFTNLLSNALKFTHSGDITLNIDLKNRVDDNRAILSFEVTDSGIGMSDEQISKLFTPFTQADNSITRKYGGTGLGLSISKKIVEAMGGELIVKSIQNRGTTFSFELEVEVSSWQEQSFYTKNQKDEKSINFSDIKVLLVEDNEINQEVASMMLKRIGIKVQIAQNGKEAVEKYFKNKNRYNIILMDLQMPIMSGYEAAKIIREDNKEIPIIALSAAAMSEDKQKVIDSGMNAHISKPVDMEILYSTITKYCTIEELNYKEDIKEKNSLVLDMEYLNKIVGSKELAIKLLIKFLHQLEDEFYNITQLILEDATGTAEKIHTLKGVSGNLGANELYNICKTIELKYKKNREITDSDCKRLESAIERVKSSLYEFNLESQNRNSFTKLNKNELMELFNEVKNRLLNNSVLPLEQKTDLYENLKESVDKNELAEWSNSVDEFEYDEALEIMSRWKL